MSRDVNGRGAAEGDRAAFGGSLNRRHFLLAGAGALLLAACGKLPENRGGPSAVAVSTIDSLIGSTPFYIAHRGSGDNWVEHSMDAYQHSVAMGAKAIEVSVNATSDGVLVCHHDVTTKRLAGKDVNIADVTFAQLSRILNSSTDWLGPAAKPQPIPRLTDVLDRYAATHVIFLEDKQGTNTRSLLDTMSKYPKSTEHLVWKTWAGASQYELAKSAGYRTWGYFTDELYARADELGPKFDYLGVYSTAADAQIRQIVAFGKPVIGWEIHYRSMRDRMSRLGVTGMMCSNVPYVTTTTASATSDAFDTGLRAAGDLPWTTDLGTAVQPTIDQAKGSVSLAFADFQSYLMGSMCPVPEKRHTLACELRWPEALPDANEHVGVAFGQQDDSTYRVRIASPVSGYHVVVRANGMIELFSREAGSINGVRLGSVKTDAPVVGQWIRLQIEVSTDHVRVYRLDGASWALETTAVVPAGGYFWLCKNYPAPIPVEFRAVSVAA
ncbi:glycerophosphodiester phosphodiesterase [Lacisediminihabitans sp.]|jgi:glycerophosphoryl diester phosphodiesterase|uniref:glycerophosphodiester phosphodiesterase n=1 Tax=Lacisediminihabitans sp. TaxID=2787631 RepID=UPI002F95AE28